MNTLRCSLFLVFSIASVSLYGQEPGLAQPDSLDRDYADELPRFPPVEPQEALHRFDVLEGFRVELVAAEPLVTDPIAFAFDAQQRLFVVEMRDYSEQEAEALGVISLLEDTDGDGRMDKRFEFASGLSWPTALWPWRDGVIVAHAPRVTWFRDIDGDGTSDTSEVWFDGFGRSNVQGLVNSFRWGVDGRIHGATSSSGASAEQLSAGNQAMLSLNRRDFAIDPLSKTLAPTTGGGQHGLSFNRWGDKFVTSNSDHLQQIVDLEQWLLAHPARVPLPNLRRSIALDGPQAEVFRGSPVEPWRVVRTRLRVAGIVPGPIEGGGRAAGYFTGATGTWIADAELGFGIEGFDTGLVCDVGSNLLHRKQLVDQGLFWEANRIDPNTELLRSSDTWFRPVQLGDGPDGAIYIADMYRETIEHPKSLPPIIKQHLDLTSGRDRGRIYRLLPQTMTANTSLAPAQLSSSQLVQQLSSPIPWQRRMATQLLVERQATPVRTELKVVLLDAAHPEAQILAMHVIHRLGLFGSELAALALEQEHPRVLQHAIALTRENRFGAKFLQRLTPLALRPEPRVQLELAMLAADLQPSARSQLLRPMMHAANEPLVRAAIAVAGGEDLWELLAALDEQELPNASLSRWLALLLPGWSESHAENLALADWMTNQIADQDLGRQTAWIDALADLSSAAEAAKLMSLLSTAQRAQLQQRIEQPLQSGNSRAADIRRLRLLPVDQQVKWADELLSTETEESAAIELIRLLDWSDSEPMVSLLLERFAAMTPGRQQECLRLIAQRKRRVELLVAAIESGVIASALIPPDVRQQLARTADRPLAERLARLLNQASTDRSEVIAGYRPHIDAADFSSAASVAEGLTGADVFQKNCATCHRLGEIGSDVGPPLRQLADKTPGQLLETILDPNREIDPRYAGYRVLLSDGRLLAGIIQGEAAGQFTLVEAGGRAHIIDRADVDELSSTGQSLMPIGFEQQITPAQMVELIRFLRRS